MDSKIQPVRIHAIYLSQGHNFRGRHGMDPDHHPVEDREAVECVAGRGLVGDRYFDYKENFKGQITFFSKEVFDDVCRTLGLEDRSPSSLRRNVLIEGVDLNLLIGKRFEIQDVRFEGTQECAPCYWMDKALGNGAEVSLTGRGGLRARILSDGVLRRGDTRLVLLGEDD